MRIVWGLIAVVAFVAWLPHPGLVDLATTRAEVIQPASPICPEHGWKAGELVDLRCFSPYSSEKVVTTADRTADGKIIYRLPNVLESDVDRDASMPKLYVPFRAPLDDPLNTIWTLPNLICTPGQVMTTDGAGTLKCGEVSVCPP